MFDPKDFPFSPDKMADYFRAYDFTRSMTDMKVPGLDPKELMKAQRKNMDALIEANKAAAEGYQNLFKKQIELFEETMEEAKKQISSFEGPKLEADAAKAQSDIAKAAFENALNNMRDLAEGAQKANAEAYEIVADRVQDSIVELQRLVKTYSA